MKYESWLLITLYPALMNKIVLLSKIICRETKTCWSHSDCPAYLRCTNGYCGDKEYFRALQERPCQEDEECEVTTPGVGVLGAGVGVLGSCVCVICTYVGVFGSCLGVYNTL